MNIQTQLCTFKTADNERLHGLLFTPPSDDSDMALVFIHGVAMNFYLPPLAIFGQELTQLRYHCFVINTRGHDWIARVGNLTKFGGSAYENLEDCLFDLDGALNYLENRGYRRFVLIGHSLGRSNRSSIRGHASVMTSSASCLVLPRNNSIPSGSPGSPSFAKP